MAIICGLDTIFMDGGSRGNVSVARKTILASRPKILIPVKLPAKHKVRGNRSVLIEDNDAILYCITGKV